MNTILGKKVGMTQIFSETGVAVPVTVIEAGPVYVTQIKTAETDGYEAVQIGYEEQKPHRVTKPLKGHFEKAQATPKKHLQEVRVENASEYQLNQEFTVEIFEVGKKLDITGVSKGREHRAISRDTATTEDRWGTAQSTRDLPAAWLQVPILPEYSREMTVREEWAARRLRYRISNSSESSRRETCFSSRVPFRETKADSSESAMP